MSNQNAKSKHQAAKQDKKAGNYDNFKSIQMNLRTWLQSRHFIGLIGKPQKVCSLRQTFDGSKPFKGKTPSKNGQALTEYLILIALVGIGSMAAVQLLGSNINKKISYVSNAIAGRPSQKIEGEIARREIYEKKDLGDFADAATDNED
jgi:hypothetical protein